MTPPTLLGYLARFASFTMQSEVLCTQALAYLLQTHEEARAAIAGLVKKHTGVGIGGSITWVPEAVQDDRGRVDLEARIFNRIPIVKIEAKLGADLGEGQLESYVKDLRSRNTGDSALLVLVPKAQIAKFTCATAEALQLSGSGPWLVAGGYRPAIAVLAWDEIFVALRSGVDKRFQYELEQLQAMYRELSSDVIISLASEEDLREWRSSKTDFVKLIDHVTRRLTTQHPLYPMGTESCEGEESPEREPVEYRRRYVCSCADNSASCFSIGVRDPFAEWVTPIWMRFRKDTGDFSRIHQRIESSDLKKNIVKSSGHIWLPLKLDFDESGEEMIQSLVEQAEGVLTVAYSTK